MLIDVAAASDIGLKKTRNEDSFGVFGEDTPDLSLFRQGMLAAVADGLGGHIGGDIASKLAVSMLRDMLKEPAPAEDDLGSEREDDYYLSILQKVIQRANESIYKTNLELVRDKRPMGTTLCAALIRTKHVYIGNVGDSRAYLVRKGKIVARTDDHSWVREQVEQGLMTQSEAENDKRRNMLTRSIGTHPEIEVDTYRWHVEAGDQLLLCSDGLNNMVSDEAILEILQRPALAQEKIEALIALANAQGGKDNITVVLAVISPDRGEIRKFKRRLWLQKHGNTIRARALLALFGAVSFALGYLACYLRSL